MNNGDNPYSGNGGGYRIDMQDAGANPLSSGADAGLSGLGARGGADDELIKDTTTARFQTDVIQASRDRPVLVDFWAPWCGPCKQLGPALEKAVREAGGSVALVKMNIDEHPAIAGQLGIQSIPAVIAFRDGQPVDGFMGAIPESQVRDFIARLGGDGRKNDIEDALAAAAAAREAGDTEGALQIYSTLLQHVPDNVDALAATAAIVFENGDSEAAQQVLDRVPAESRDAPAVAAVRARMALAEQVLQIGDPAALAKQLSIDPQDHQARFDLALIQNARGERQAAADNLLTIVKADRQWKDDAARAKLVELFEAWGAGDEATLAARRKLSSLLFS